MRFYKFRGKRFLLEHFRDGYQIIDVCYYLEPDDELTLPSHYENIPIIKISDSAFHNLIERRVTIPSTVQYIGHEAFRNVKNLEKVDFQDKSQLKVIGQGAFASTSINNFCIPKSVETISSYAFFDTPLQKLSFGNGAKLKEIGVNAFGYSNLHSVTLNFKDIVIKSRAFADNKYLETVNLKNADSLQLDSNVFEGCPNLKEVILPAYGCKYYNDTFPSNIVKSIQDSLLFS